MVTVKTFNTREEWLENRRQGIGGSDIASVIGANPFMSNTELWEIKRGNTKPGDLSDNPRVMYGVKAEQYLRGLFMLDHPEYEVMYDEFNSVYNDRYPWALASLDGWTIEKETGRRGVLEIKTTEIMSATDWDKWTNGIPQNYFCQCLMYMAVTESQFADLRAAIKYTDKEGDKRTTIRDYHIERADVDDDINYLMFEGEKFWWQVEKGIRPGLILPNI